MGISPSKRVTQTLTKSSTFTSSCDSTYTETLSLSQHAFPGLPPYQLPTAVLNLHTSLTSTLPIISTHLPSPPPRDKIDSAYKSVIRRKGYQDGTCLGREEFREFALEVFVGAVLEGVGMEVVRRVGVGALGIVGVGKVARTGSGLVGVALGVYALGVAGSVYLGLG